MIVNNGSDEFCEGSSTELQSSPGYSGWLWNTGESTEAITVVTGGSYSLVGIDAYGCESVPSAEATITVNPRPEKPVISYTTPLTFFIGDSVVLTSSTAVAYLWSPGNQTTDSIVVKTSGDYSVRVEDLLGCQSEWSDPVTVVVKNNEDKPELTTNGPLSFCLGNSVTISGPEGYAAYLWSNGETTREITVIESGTFTLVVTNSLGFESIPSDEIVVTVFALPVIDVSEAIDPLCYQGNDGRISISVSSGTSPYSYEWSGQSSTGDELSNVSAGEYQVMVTDANGCADNETVALSEPDQLVLTLSSNDAYCPDIADGTITVSVSGGTGSYAYYLNDVEVSGTIDQLAESGYDIRVEDSNGCTVSSEWYIGVLNDICFKIPEILTPNNDGYNDQWIIEGLEAYPNVSIEVFDRWGKRVYYSEGNQGQAFDGTFNGKELPMESYHYVIDLHNGSQRIIGNLTIIR